MRPTFLANPPNPWHSSYVDYLGEPPPVREHVYEENARSILSRNESPDIPFRWSVNPYRGCFHGCAYCYARPTHERLGLGAGTDFERVLSVKTRAPALLREAFAKASWAGESVTFSGNTDCYQPLEASYGLTRGCLEVCAEFANPVTIITKSPLIERDVDVLRALAARAPVTVVMSIAFWNERHARAIEPYVATPARRVRTVEKLAAAGLEVVVLVAPLIPGLNDEDIGPLLRAAKEAGASSASAGLLRLPGATREVFLERLREALPERYERVVARIRETRGGSLSDPRFGARQRGEGHYADALHALFDAHARRLGLRGDENARARDEGAPAGAAHEGGRAARGHPVAIRDAPGAVRHDGKRALPLFEQAAGARAATRPARAARAKASGAADDRQLSLFKE